MKKLCIKAQTEYSWRYIKSPRTNNIQVANGSSQAPGHHHSQAPRKATHKGNGETRDADRSKTSFLMLEEKVSPQTVRGSIFISNIKEDRRPQKCLRDGHRTARDKTAGRRMFIFNFVYVSREKGSYCKC